MHETGHTEIIAESQYIRLVRRGTWEYAERLNISGVVGILAVNTDGQLLLVEQYRPPVDARVIELPAGLAGDVAGNEQEELAEAAKRELLEETGYAAREMTFLCEGPPSSGMTNEMITLFRAHAMTKIGDGGGDHSEEITVHAVPLKDVPDWLEAKRRQGVLIDMRIYTALFFLQNEATAK